MALFQDHEDSSTDEEEEVEACFQISLGLCEVLPSPEPTQSPARDSPQLPTHHLLQDMVPSPLSPFESSPISDPFQFTVRLPRLQSSPTSSKPPWNEIVQGATDKHLSSYETVEPSDNDEGSASLELPTHFLLQGVAPSPTHESKQRLAGYRVADNGEVEGVSSAGVYVGLPTEGLLHGQ